MTSTLNRSPLAHRRCVDRCEPPGFQASAVSLLHSIVRSPAPSSSSSSNTICPMYAYSRRPDTAAPIPSKLCADTFSVGVRSQGYELYQLPSRMFLCIARLVYCRRTCQQTHHNRYQVSPLFRARHIVYDRRSQGCTWSTHRAEKKILEQIYRGKL